MPAIVQELGTAAALASVVGLALLSALHVSHAREVKRLREWAGRAPERPRQDGTAVPERAARVPSPSRRRHSRIGTRSAAVALAGLLAVAAAYGVTQLIGGDNSGKSQAPTKPKRKVPAVNRAKVVVAVLNGTTVPGLAAALREEIAAAGFKKGTIDTFSDQELPESVVQYAPGHQAEAKAVSRTIGISRREPVTAGSRVLAGDATVVVIAGADKAGNPL